LAVLIVDIGNTLTKVGVYHEEKLLETLTSDFDPHLFLSECIQKFNIETLFISSVREEAVLAEHLNKLQVNFDFLNQKTRLPVKNLYETPKTLGKDRLAAVIGAWALNQGNEALIVDAGTCITYDWLNNENAYVGGNISPGLHMRLEAMHHFTHRLPLAELKDVIRIFAKSTDEALSNGVAVGVLAEIKFYMNALNSNAALFLTGGAGKWISNQLDIKHNYDPTLVIKGLYELYRYNNKN
jgi:type III pantothenate kinase